MSTLVPSSFNGSFSLLQVTRKTIKAWITLNFCQIQRLTTKLSALECLNNQCLHFFSVANELFKLADKEEMHTCNILDVMLF